MNIIEQILMDIRPEADFTSSEDFTGDGLLDSFDVVTLVADLDKRFAISIAGIDILAENFRNIAAIRQLLEKYGVKS